MPSIAIEISLELTEGLNTDAVERLRADVKRYLSHMFDAARANDGRIRVREVTLNQSAVSQPTAEDIAIEEIGIARLRHGAQEVAQNSRALRATHRRVTDQAHALTQQIAEFRERLSELHGAQPAHSRPQS